MSSHTDTAVQHDYSYAEAQVDRLTPNQRRVLDLLVRGKTNAQVGEALGITLDGAKWNVSEVLSKLGFSSREEAAAYWRWRNTTRQRLSRSIRGFAAIPAFKWAAGGAGLLSAVAVGAFIVAASSDKPESAADGWFYLEADITVTSRAATVGTNVNDDRQEPEPEVTISHLTWWMQDERHGRWQVAGLVGVADGQSMWLYSQSEETYWKSPLPADGPSLLAPPMSFTIGPAYQSSLDDFVASLLEYADEAEVIGTAEILGRPVTIVEARPAGRSVTETVGADGTVTTSETADGSMRYWVDEEEMLVLRYEVESPVQHVTGEVTHLSLQPEISPDLLTFVPPQGAHEQSTEPQQYCAGPPADETGGQRLGPVSLRMPPRVTLEADEITQPILVWIDHQALSLAGDEPLTVRALPAGEGPMLAFSEVARTGGPQQATPAPSVVVDRGQAVSGTQDIFYAVLLHADEPGCHQFELEIAGNPYGPFGLDIVGPGD